MITNISSGIKKKYVDEQDDALAAQISGKAPTNHASSGTTYGVSTASVYGHAMASSTTPKANGTAAVGTETAKFARGDHVHPLQTTVSGNAGSATKLATARTITINGESSGASFNGTANITIPLTKDTSPTANSAHVITSGAVYAAIQTVKSDVASVYKVKGSITWSNLIVKTDAEVGDVYNVTDGTYAGANFVCVKANTAGESSWDKLSETLDLSPYAKTADVNTALAGKQAKVTGAATTVVSSNLTASRALVSDANGKIAASGITSTQLGYLSGVTSSIQAQLDAKQAKLTIDSALSSTSTNPVQNKAVVIGLTGKVTANSAITAATKCKITYDAKGLVTAGANLAASDIPALDASKITSGTLGTDRIPTLPISKISGLQNSLNAKQATVTGAATTVVSANLTANMALVSDSNGKIAASGVTLTKLNKLSAVGDGDTILTNGNVVKTVLLYVNHNNVFPTSGNHTTTDSGILITDGQCRVIHGQCGIGSGLSRDYSVALPDVPALGCVPKITTGTIYNGDLTVVVSVENFWVSDTRTGTPYAVRPTAWNAFAQYFRGIDFYCKDSDTDSDREGAFGFSVAYYV